MTSLYQVTKHLLAVHNRLPQKRLGQNFLIDEQALALIVSSAGLEPNDSVLEIGCGLGVLTQALADHAGYVVTMDVDKEMIGISKEVLKKYSNVEYVYADFLKWEMSQDFTKVAANVPYYITSPIIEKLLNEFVGIKKIVLTVQKEVAERIAAQPGTKKFGSFSVFVQNRANAFIAGYISKKAFYPQPNVESAVLVLEPLGHLRFNIDEKIVKAAFSQRRKMIRSTLKGFNFDFDKLGIDPRRRAETLSLEEYARLSEK